MVSFKGYLSQETSKEFLAFYEDQLFNNVLPFWIENGIDLQYGGYFNCFTNSTYEMVSDDKYVWSQGRFIWLFSMLADLVKQESSYLNLAKIGFEFLKDNCFLENGHCAFLLNRQGVPKEPIKGMGFDVSIFADCFVILGFSKYATVSGDTTALKIALETFELVINRIESGEIKTEPEPTPSGFRSHGVSMILLNVSQGITEALERFGHKKTEWARAKKELFYRDILTNFLNEDNIILELVTDSPELREGILGRYVNPGHSVECMWFVMHEAMKYRDSKVILQAISVIKTVIKLGWDIENGGIFQFIDKVGGKPQGKTDGFDGHPMISKLNSDWDTKLWWVHSEALYSTLLGYCLTGDDAVFQLYKKVFAYTFQTFPHPERQKGEWIQIRDRRGNPSEKVVALPVKDPFHIIRNFALIIELLSQYCLG